MRLLITTQAVDLDDPVLGFFHRWIEEFAKHSEKVIVICLKEGRHSLPAHVEVYSLGKDKGGSSIRYAIRFIWLSWKLRNRYDEVFCHMNPEYPLLMGWFWRFLHKPVLLWYIHPKAFLPLRIAHMFVNKVITATPRNLDFPKGKTVILSLGIDTEYFVPHTRASSIKLRITNVGRIAPVKRLEIMIKALEILQAKGIAYRFDQYGEALERDRKYDATIRAQSNSLQQSRNVLFHGPITQADARDVFAQSDIYINATPKGSFDKAQLEAMSSGCITVSSNPALKEILEPDCYFEEGNAHALADCLTKISALSIGDREQIQAKQRAWVIEHHSLSNLIPAIIRQFDI
jgi:glycosyltransferase involved in cell wall biosynthesis